MRLRHRRDDALTEERSGDVGVRGTTGEAGARTTSGDPRVTRSERETYGGLRDRRGDDLRGTRGDPVIGDEVVETTTRRWDVGSVLATAAGVALTVIGVLALIRTGVDESWYQPVENIAGFQHTPLLGAIEVGVGALLILAGLAGSPVLAALVALVAGLAAAIVAFEPSLVDDELGMERGWATLLAVLGLTLALVLIMTRDRKEERRIQRRPIRTA
jgi:hypothetical protein